MSEALKSRILKIWHDPAIQKLIGDRGEKLWNSGPEAIRAELMGLMKTNPKVYWSEPVQEALGLTVAAQDYAANAGGNPGYEPEMPPEAELSDAQRWARHRAQGGAAVSGGSVGEAYADSFDESHPDGRRDDGTPRFGERIPLEQRVRVMRPAEQVYGGGASTDETPKE